MVDAGVPIIPTIWVHSFLSAWMSDLLETPGLRMLRLKADA